MTEVPAELQMTFYGASIATGLWLLALYFTVCGKLHNRVREDERKLAEQHQGRLQVSGADLWTSMQQRGLLDQRIRSVDRLDLLIRLIGGAAVLSGIVGFVVLGLKESYGFNPTTGTLLALLLELLPFISLAAVLATLFVTYQAISLVRWFAKAADVAQPPNRDRPPGVPDN